MAEEYPTTDMQLRQRLLSRKSALESERSTWIPHWKELSENILPRNSRFFISDRNNGAKRHNNILDNAATRALRILAAGMMSGMTSPARPWFRLALADEDLMDHGPVKRWLADVRGLMLNVFARSNVYLTLHSMYEDLGVFGTSATLQMGDFDRVTHLYHSPIGEYCLASDYRGNVNTIYRHFEKTVGEIVGEFGLENCSTTIKRLHSAGSLDTWVPIVHAIEPRVDRDPRKRNAKNKAYKSCYFEPGEDAVGKMLREGGFDKFIGMAPRWNKNSGDVYGMSPGMEAFGDIKQLQHEQLRKANGIDYQTKPPVQVPISLKGKDVNMLPGGKTYVDATGADKAIRNMFDVNINLEHLLADIYDVRERIRGAFYADLFLMIANSDNTNMTATEVAERHEEKLLMLGPVLERLQGELLKPLIDNTFDFMLRAGIIPPPPDELQGVEIDVEFVSMLAQAQRAVGVNSIDRFVGSLGVVAQFKPDVLDKLDADKWADAYADMLGVDPELIVATEDVAIVRQQRAQAQAQEQRIMQAEAEANAAAKLGTVKTDEKNAATDILNLFSGYQTPPGTEL